MKKLAILTILLIVAGCGGAEVDPAQTPAMPPEEIQAFYVRGILQEIDGNRVLVEDEVMSLVWVSLQVTPPADAEMGSLVEIETTGVVMESYPSQTRGEALIILAPPANGGNGGQPGQEEPVKYTLVKNRYESQERDLVIEYYQVEDMKGELVMDYINQSLKAIYNTYESYESVTLEARILRNDDYLTIAHQGNNFDMGYTIEHYLSLHMPTATELTVENVIGDMEGFGVLFRENTGFDMGELEGLKVYMTNEAYVFTFVPPDDMAERIYWEVTMTDIAPYLGNMDFEMPAS